MLLSDITNNKGNCVIKEIPFGDKSHLKNSNLQWPNQPSPNKNRGNYGLALSPTFTV